MAIVDAAMPSAEQRPVGGDHRAQSGDPRSGAVGVDPRPRRRVPGGDPDRLEGRTRAQRRAVVEPRRGRRHPHGRRASRVRCTTSQLRPAKLAPSDGIAARARAGRRARPRHRVLRRRRVRARRRRPHRASSARPPTATDGPSTLGGLLRQLSFQLSGAQLGITVTSVVLGFVAEPAVAELLPSDLRAGVARSPSPSCWPPCSRWWWASWSPRASPSPARSRTARP